VGSTLHGRVRSPLSHRLSFDLLRTHLLCERPLTGAVDPDRATVLAALGAGTAWLTCPFVASAEGARLWVEREDGGIVPMGGEAPRGPAVLHVRLPRPADMVALCNGAPIHAVRDAALDVRIEGGGVYRVEARIDGRLWLLSNPVHLR
jgi:hypothetical protein